MKLQHEDGEASASKVTVHYDGKIIDLEVDDEGITEVSNKLEAQELQTSHGKFFPVNEDEENDLPSYVLEDKNVDEVEGYVRSITDRERLKELRRLEKDGKDRDTAVKHIDARLGELNEPEPQEDEEEEEEESVEENQGQKEEDEEDEEKDDEEVPEEDEEENGEETEE